MLHRRLKGIGATQFRVDDDEANRPVDGDGQTDKEDDAREQAGLFECVRLTNDPGASANRTVSNTNQSKDWLDISLPHTKCTNTPRTPSLSFPTTPQSQGGKSGEGLPT